MNALDRELKEISDSIIAEYDFNRYAGITDEHGIVEAVQCTWCGRCAPLGVPIAHDDCSKPKEERNA